MTDGIKYEINIRPCDKDGQPLPVTDVERQRMTVVMEQAVQSWLDGVNRYRPSTDRIYFDEITLTRTSITESDWTSYLRVRESETAVEA